MQSSPRPSSTYIFTSLTIYQGMMEKEEGTGQRPGSQETPASEETMDISTLKATGFKMSKVQTGLLMCALCVRNLKYSVNALVTNQPVLHLPCGLGYHNCDNSAPNHLGSLPKIFGLRLGRFSVHACRWGVNTNLGQGQRHLGTQTNTSRRHWYLFHRKYFERGLSLHIYVDCGTSCTRPRRRWAPDFVKHHHLGSFLHEVLQSYMSVSGLELIFPGSAPNGTV